MNRIPTEPARQAASAVLLVRPACFGWNAETQASNRFQREASELVAVAQERALAEFDGLAARLQAAGVEAFVGDDDATARCPDAVFPNNWVTLHPDGTVVLYPMLAPCRRRERRLDLVAMLERRGGFRVERLLDLTYFEAAGEFLEGTGSIVFDHVRRIAYAALSPRTHVAPLRELCAELGYEPCVFAAADATGAAIYHTNVMLAIGSGFAVVAAECIASEQRAQVLARLRDCDRDVIEIDAAAMAAFAGNMLELRSAAGRRVLAMSQSAATAFGAAGLERLGRSVDLVVAAPVPTIETLGGGSVRCMIAEVFLPR